MSFDGPPPPEPPSPSDPTPKPEPADPQAPPPVGAEPVTPMTVTSPPATPVADAPPPPGPEPGSGPPTGAYPVDLDVPHDPGQNRLWGIPFLGLWVRAILIIPQAIVLWIMGIVVGLALFISWIPILINGRMALWGYQLFGGVIRLSTRVALYVLLITGDYPPFWLSGQHAVELRFDPTERQNRLWGIPLLGIAVRWILLIPHFIVLWFLGVGVLFVTLLSWFPVLLTGRQADPIVDFAGGVYRWGVRVAAYGFLLTGTYPPFRLGA